MDWNKVAIILSAVGTFLAGCGLILLARQIIDSRRFIKAQFINELVKEIQAHSEIYRNLHDGGIWSRHLPQPEKEVDVLAVADYLSFFEKINCLLDAGVIDLRTINELFNYRFFLIVHNPHIQTAVLYREQYRKSLASIFTLHKAWIGYLQSHGRGEGIMWKETMLDPNKQA